MSEEIAKALVLRFSSEPRAVGLVRRRFEEFMQAAPASSDELEGLKVAVSEACTNAIVHGSPRGARSHFRVRCLLSGRDLTVEVMDEGTSFWSLRKVHLPAAGLLLTGRGIFLMKHFSDRVEVQSGRTGSVVRIHKRLAGETARVINLDRAHQQAMAAPSRRGSEPPLSAAVAG